MTSKLPEGDAPPLSMVLGIAIHGQEGKRSSSSARTGRLAAPPYETYKRSRRTNSSRKALPNPAGDLSTMTPADSKALILESAPPLPPETMAPAWPMRRPGGAEMPAMKD